MSVRPPDRREFLRLLAGATVGACFQPAGLRATALPDDFVRLSLLHTTDLRGHILPTVDYHGRYGLGGFARCVTQINRWRAENPNSLLIDIGDVYQGTQFALADRGRSMIDLFNLLQYDAWLVGNHEFDWGIEPFLHALDRSAMPVLAANTLLEGKPAGDFADAHHPFAKIQPLIVREIAGIKIALVGLTTPGMPFWFPPKFTEGMAFQNPIEPARRAIAQARSLGANAIVLAGHMGLKERTGGDDFANHVVALTAEFPEVAVFIAGHTHQDISSRLTNGVILTQADHFGIHVGRVDLFFDRDSKKLLHQEARCELMDSRVALDPVIMNRAQPQLDLATIALAQPIGQLTENLSAKASLGEASQIEDLIAAAVTEALAQRGLTIDGVFHGLFDEHVFKKGPKTVADIWTILPYENYLVTGELTRDELWPALEQVWQGHERRSLVGFAVSLAGKGSDLRLTSLSLADGRPLDPSKRYRIALNSFDASSGGHRFMKLREILARPEARRTLQPVQTRDALIEYFRRHQMVGRISLPPAKSAA